MESALTTSPPSASARASPRSDLPVAVGPTTATTGRAERRSACGGGASRSAAPPLTSPRLGPGDHVIADAVRRGELRRTVARSPAVDGTGQDLPRHPAADHELVGQVWT